MTRIHVCFSAQKSFKSFSTRLRFCSLFALPWNRPFLPAPLPSNISATLKHLRNIILKQFIILSWMLHIQKNLKKMDSVCFSLYNEFMAPVGEKTSNRSPRLLLETRLLLKHCQLAIPGLKTKLILETRLLLEVLRYIDPTPIAAVCSDTMQNLGANYKKILRLSYDAIITYDNRKSNLR